MCLLRTIQSDRFLSKKRVVSYWERTPADTAATSSRGICRNEDAANSPWWRTWEEKVTEFLFVKAIPIITVVGLLMLSPQQLALSSWEYPGGPSSGCRQAIRAEIQTFPRSVSQERVGVHSFTYNPVLPWRPPWKHLYFKLLSPELGESVHGCHGHGHAQEEVRSRQQGDQLVPGPLVHLLTSGNWR